MSEKPRKPIEAPETRGKSNLEQVREYAAEMQESCEVFPFPTIGQTALTKIRATEAECPGVTTPIDEMIELYATEGVRVVVGRDARNVFVVPARTLIDRIDWLEIKNLAISDAMDPRLREVVALAKIRSYLRPGVHEAAD